MFWDGLSGGVRGLEAGHGAIDKAEDEGRERQGDQQAGEEELT